MKEKSIFHLIRTVEQFTNQTIIQFTKEYGTDIGIGHILVLHVLNENGALKQADIASHLGYSPGGITHIATRLIRNGYVKREYNKGDRRIIKLAITAEGMQALEQAEKTGVELRKKMYSILNIEEIEQLTNITEKMLKSLQKDQM